MVITYEKLLYCNGVVEGNVNKKVSTLEYRNRTVYDWFNDTFKADFSILDLHLPPITIDDIPCLHKRARYIPDLLSAAIYVAYGNYVSTLTIPSDSPDLLPHNDLNTIHVIKKDLLLQGWLHRGYCCRKYGKKYATKIQGSIAPHDLTITRNFIIVMGFKGLVHWKGLASWNMNILSHNFQLIFVFVSLPPFYLPVELVLCLFYSCYIDHYL